MTNSITDDDDKVSAQQGRIPEFCSSVNWQQQVQDLVAKVSAQLMAYHSGQLALEVRYKPDGSPVTTADMAAHHLICDVLRKWLPDVPILSEEGDIPSLAKRQDWPRFWLVDPLDGTRDFISKTAEFSVNIALIEHQRPIFGLLILPAQQCCYWGGPNMGVFCHDWRGNTSSVQQLTRVAINAPPFGLTISRYQPSRVQQCQTDFMMKLKVEVQLMPCSAAVKFADLLHGRAHLYPRFSNICEWDVAAGDALLSGLGGLVVNIELKPYRYNQKESLHQACFFAMSHAQLLQLAGTLWQSQMADLPAN